MLDLVSPKQVAQAIGVSESSLKRWCDQGVLPVIKTAGGHRRIPVSGVLAYLRTQGHEMVAPELLGLPRATTGGSERRMDEERRHLVDALITGDEARSVTIVLNLYLAKHPLSVICDEVLCAAFQEIGEKWGCGEVQVYQERRSCELCHRLLYELRRALPELRADAPIAVGGTLDGDPYTLASAMAELVLREHGWRASSLGNMLPFGTLRTAVCDTRPQLFWLSVAAVRDEELFCEEYARLRELTAQHNIAVVVGGKAISPRLRQRISCECHCESFGQLAKFAETLHNTTASLPITQTTR